MKGLLYSQLKHAENGTAFQILFKNCQTKSEYNSVISGSLRSPQGIAFIYGQLYIHAKFEQNLSSYFKQTIQKNKNLKLNTIQLYMGV